MHYYMRIDLNYVASCLVIVRYQVGSALKLLLDGYSR